MDKLTEKQEKAISMRGIPIVLSAAAGSGKTRVLTTRAAKNTIPLENQLIITFTVAAADSMKEKISEFGLDIENANIGTIDSLCGKIVKENIEKTNLPTNFRIGNENELTEIRNEAISKALDEFYEKDDESFKKILTLFCKKDDDSALEETVNKILIFAESYPDSKKWLLEQEGLFDNCENDVSDTIWGKTLIDYAKEIITEAKILCKNEIEIIDECSLLEPYKVAIESDLDYLHSFPFDKKWDDLYNYANSFSPKRFAVVKGDFPEKEKIGKIRDSFKKLVKDKIAKKIFAVNEDSFLNDIFELAPLSKCLFDLAIRCDQIETETKEEIGIVSFADVAQYASKILEDEKTVQNYRNQFKEVLVDEFQDVNQVQFSLISRLTENLNNLFVVGDIKQSIYRFRKADPTIFKSLIEKFNGTESVMWLNDNFRSRKEVTKTVNHIFSQIMSEKYGEVCYNENEVLNPKASYIEDGDYNTEIFIVKDEDLQIEEENSKAEPIFVANKISELIKDNVSPKEIAILLRNGSNILSYKNALERNGINVIVENNSKGFLNEPDIIYSINALKAVSNPTRSLELFGLMTSPLFNFSDTEIAKIRLNDKKSSLYSCVINSAKEDLKCQNFLSEFNKLRILSYTLTPSEFISKLFINPTANQSLLIEYAESYNTESIKTLDGFIKFLDMVRERGKDLEPAVKIADENSVTLTTIHSSKGLEWSYVFVCECHKEFGYLNHEMKDSVILNSDMGFACKKRDIATLIERPTMPMYALKAKVEQSAISEEMRIFYVALTRAKQKLFIIGSSANPNSVLEKEVPSVRSAKSYLDWLLYTCRNDIKVGYAVYQKKAEKQSQIKKINYRLDDNFTYEYLLDTTIPAKMTVTELTHKSNDSYFEAEPKFIGINEPKGKTLGTILHEYLKTVDFNAPDVIPKELTKLKVKEFFVSDIVKRIKSAKKVLREFNMMAPHEYMGGETILQGIADLVIFEDDGIILVDYKTDKADSEEILLTRYSAQLNLYADMLEASFSMKVKEKIIYSFHLGKEIKC